MKGVLEVMFMGRGSCQEAMSGQRSCRQSFIMLGYAN